MNTAERIIKPDKPGIFRIVFLYTGQGESTLLVIPNGPKKEDYIYFLVDSDLDKEPDEIDLIAMFKDLFKNGGKLRGFINTHPHNDHIGGIREIYDEIGFTEVWHSNHRAGGKHKKKYADFKYVIDKVGKANEFFLKGTNDPNKIRKSDDSEVIKKLGEIDYQVFSPAEYLCGEIDDKDADERDRRIHELCGVVKFTYGEDAKSILITGDSDKAAWQDHITEYHKANLPSYVLSASHHGSRTFFKTDEDDEDIYETHIENIKPTYLVISAPKQEDSPHGHPHDDAIELYENHVEKDNILHLGANVESVIVDIDAKGNIEVRVDKDLIAEYGKPEDGEKNEAAKIAAAGSVFSISSQTTRIDSKPSGSDEMV
jgi:competence protein ComEC